MKKVLLISSFFAVVIWLAFGSMLLGLYQPSWLPSSFLKLGRPTTLSDFGQAFSALEGLLSSFALMLGLIAIVVQVKQNSDSNIIGAFAARQQFLLAEYERLDGQIAKYVATNSGPNYDKVLVQNMTNKRKERLDESRVIDQKLLLLLAKI